MHIGTQTHTHFRNGNDKCKLNPYVCITIRTCCQTIDARHRIPPQQCFLICLARCLCISMR